MRMHRGTCAALVIALAVRLHSLEQPSPAQQSQSNQQSQSPQQGGTTINVGNEIVRDPAEIIRATELMLDLNLMEVDRTTETILVRNSLKVMYRDLDAQDATTLKDVIVHIEPSDEVNATAFRNPDGKRQINFNTALYRYLDKLIVAVVMAQEHNARPCAVAYSAYLVQMARANFTASSQRKPYFYEVLEPEFFADRHLDICPEFPHPGIKFEIPPERQTDTYANLLGFSFLFVSLHEFAHQRNGDIDLPIPQNPDARWFANQRKREEAADDFALDYFIKHKTNPLLALPVMFLIADLQDFSVAQGDQDTHPVTLSRVRGMFEASKKVLKSKKFRKWLRKEDQSKIQTSQEFMDFMDRTL